MTSAVWMILYELDTTCTEEYLHWFHEVHIPEKLDRPGYTWAAHYRAAQSGDAKRGSYIAMFGGRDSRVFYNPSPAQIKPRQSPETRAMMACRSNSRMLILAREWIHGEPANEAAISAEQIQLALFDANGNDEQLGAWLSQDFVATATKSGKVHKFLASTGNPRHVLVHEAANAENTPMLDRAWNDWSEHASGYLSYPAGEPLLARRIWPDGNLAKLC